MIKLSVFFALSQKWINIFQKFFFKVYVFPTYVHYENKPIQIYWKFYHQKMKFLDKNTNIFFKFLLKT